MNKIISLIFSLISNSFVIGKKELLFLPLIVIFISNLKALLGFITKQILFQLSNLIHDFILIIVESFSSIIILILLISSKTKHI